MGSIQCVHGIPPRPVMWFGVGRELHLNMLYGEYIIAGASKSVAHRCYMVVCM